MKKFILAILMVLLVSTGAYSERTQELTADTLIDTGIGVFRGIFIITDGTNNVTVDIYDATSAVSGKEIIPSWVVLGNSRFGHVSFDDGEGYGTGLYVDITTAGTATFIVYYDAR